MKKLMKYSLGLATAAFYSLVIFLACVILPSVHADGFERTGGPDKYSDGVERTCGSRGGNSYAAHTQRVSPSDDEPQKPLPPPIRT